MKKLILAMMCTILLVFSACGGQEIARNDGKYGGEEGFELFLEEIQPVEDPWTTEEVAEFKAYIEPSEFEHIFTREQMQEFMTAKNGKLRITYEEAVEDINVLFDLLAYVYGGYNYFGGDEVFLPIRDKILAELKGEDDQKTDILTQPLFQNVGKELLKVMEDGHIGIEKHHFTYFVRDLYFDDPTGIDPAYVKHTIGPEGAITYCLATVCKDGEVLPTTLVIEGTERTLEWSRAGVLEVSQEERELVYSETTAAEGKLPVVANRQLMGDEDRLKEFAATGNFYRNQPVFVLDLRGNGGGSDNYSNRWLKSVSGKLILPKVLFAHKYSNARTQSTGSKGEWKITIDSHGTLWEKDNTVFVLIDKNVASSGEYFVNMLTLGKRVVLVGSNTCGALNFSNMMNFYLPNSGANISLGTSLAFYDAVENRDGIGYFPDLWVEPGESLEAVERLCKYYGLIE